MQSPTPSGNPPNSSTASSQAAQDAINNFTKAINRYLGQRILFNYL